jgi:hypothetical protein
LAPEWVSAHINPMPGAKASHMAVGDLKCGG